MCTCDLHMPCDDCSRYADAHYRDSINKIDWTKPIRWVKGSECRQPLCKPELKVETISKIGYQACLRCGCGQIWLFHKSGRCVEFNVENSKIENVPETPKEQWVNVWWDTEQKRPYVAARYRSEEIARIRARAGARLSAHHYLGTFKV